MLFRELKREGKQLIVSLLPVVLGIALVVSLTTVKNFVLERLGGEERELAGADLSLSIRGKPTDAYEELASQIPGQRVRELRFPSMLGASEGALLVQVQGYDGAFPFYGKREVQPLDAEFAYLEGKSLLIEESALLQLGLEVGERVKLGNTYFVVSGVILNTPGETELRMTLAPRVVASISNLEQAGLLQYGIRQNTVTHYKTDPSLDLTSIADQAQAIGADLETPASRRVGLSESIDKVYNYISLFAFATLIVGALGAASGGAYYAARKARSVALFRCIGATLRELLVIYGLTFSISSALFALIGCVLALPLLILLRGLLAQYLPVELPLILFPDWNSAGLAFALGALVPVCFAAPAILSLRKISPLAVLRQSEGLQQQTVGQKSLWLSAGAFLTLGLLSGPSTLVVVALAGALLLLVSGLYVFAFLMKRLLQGPVRRRLSFAYKHGLSSLVRPGRDTLFVMILIALPTFFAVTLYNLQGAITAELDRAMAQSRDDIIFFDVQKDQQKPLKVLGREYGLSFGRFYPLIGMRLRTINQVSVAEKRELVEDSREEWFLTREYLNTYRDYLMETEELVDGVLPGHSDGERIPVTVENRMVERLGLKLGDHLLFDVQGVEVATEIVGIRKFNFRGVNPGFFVVFPPGVLEDAPQFAVGTASVGPDAQLLEFKKAAAESLPNVSVIDARDIRQTINNLFSKLRLVVFTLGALFALSAALVVYVNILLSKDLRRKEQNLYRILGAGKKTLKVMARTEFFALGFVGGSSAVIFSALFLQVAGSFALDLSIPFSWFTSIFLPLALASALAVIGSQTTSR